MATGDDREIDGGSRPRELGRMPSGLEDVSRLFDLMFRASGREEREPGRGEDGEKTEFQHGEGS